MKKAIRAGRGDRAWLAPAKWLTDKLLGRKQTRAGKGRFDCSIAGMALPKWSARRIHLKTAPIIGQSTKVFPIRGADFLTDKDAPARTRK